MELEVPDDFSQEAEQDLSGSQQMKSSLESQTLKHWDIW